MKGRDTARQTTSAKKQTGEYATFSAALKRVLSVSPSDLKAKLEAEKSAKRKGKPSASNDK